MLKTLLRNLLSSFINNTDTRQLMSASAYPSDTEISIPATGDASAGWAMLAVYTAPCDGVVSVHGTTASTHATDGVCYLAIMGCKFRNAVILPETGGTLQYDVSAIVRKGEQLRVDGDSFTNVSIKFYKRRFLYTYQSK